jgi:glycosyltransferase involved in cell wall biosynthesis
LAADFAALAPTVTLPEWSEEWTVDALRRRLELRRLLTRLRARAWPLVYSNTATNGYVLELIGSRQPIVSHVHELATTIDSFGKRNFDAVRRHTTRFIACAEAVKHELTGRSVDPAIVDVVHGFISTSPDAGQSAAARPRVRDELRIPQDAFVVGGSGYVSWRKAPDVFLALARTVARRRPSAPIHFVWVGAMSGHISASDLEHDARRLGIETRIHFIGSRPNPLDYFAAFDVFALVSREDPFPLVCLEVASLGIPIVCFDGAGGAKEFVEQDCGFVLPYQDVEHMADAILTLQQCEEHRATLGRRAAEKVRLRHDINRAAPQIVDIVERLMTTPRHS